MLTTIPDKVLAIRTGYAYKINKQGQNVPGPANLAF